MPHFNSVYDNRVQFFRFYISIYKVITYSVLPFINFHTLS